MVLSPRAADGVLRSIERPVPVPGTGEVLLRVRAASLNYRDLLVADNVYGSAAERLVPLSDGAGEVAALGPGVTGLTRGDRVAGAFYPDWIAGPVTAAARARALGATMDGMLAEHVLLPAQAVIPFPGHLSFEEAATLPCAGLTAWHALRLAGLRPGATVLLLGSGGVSVMALQFAKRLGLQVIQTSGSAAKRARLIELGADHVIDYRAEPDWDRRVLELTGGGGVDLVVEVGGPGTLQRSMRAARVGGDIVAVGFVAGGPGIDPRPLISRAIRLTGITVGSVEMFGEMNRFIADTGLRPVIDRVLPMTRAAEGYALLRGAGHFGKIVFRIPG